MRLKRFVAVLLAACALFAMCLTISAQEYGSTTTNVTFLPGELLLEEISSFNFGEHPIEAAGRSLPAEESMIYLNVQDLRGSGVGWKITAVGGVFNAPANTLPGSFIKFTGGTAVPGSPGNTPPNVNQNIILDMDGAASSEIARAPAGAGLGNWSLEWSGTQYDNTSVMLNVPGGIGTIGTHTATITWTLANAP